MIRDVVHLQTELDRVTKERDAAVTERNELRAEIRRLLTDAGRFEGEVIGLRAALAQGDLATRYGLLLDKLELQRVQLDAARGELADALRRAQETPALGVLNAGLPLANHAHS